MGSFFSPPQGMGIKVAGAGFLYGRLRSFCYSLHRQRVFLRV
jgi:hypothetical protein